jgi:hypothetical protein
MDPEDGRVLRTLFRFVFVYQYMRHRALLHVMSERIGVPPGRLETDARVWLEEHLDGLNEEAYAELDRFVERIGQPAWWP